MHRDTLGPRSFPIEAATSCISEGSRCCSLGEVLRWSKWRMIFSTFFLAGKEVCIPSRELTYPPEKLHFEDDFPFPQVGYVNSLEGR